MPHCGAAADGGRMAFTISGPSTKCSLYRKQSPATVRRMSRLRRYDPPPIMCRARRWMAVRRAKVVGLRSSTPACHTLTQGGQSHGTRLPSALGLPQPIALQKKPSCWAPRTASYRIWLRNASCLSKVTPRSLSSSTSGTTAPMNCIAFSGIGEQWLLMANACDFVGSNLILHLLPQAASESTACWRIALFWQSESSGDAFVETCVVGVYSQLRPIRQVVFWVVDVQKEEGGAEDAALRHARLDSMGR